MFRLVFGDRESKNARNRELVLLMFLYVPTKWASPRFLVPVWSCPLIAERCHRSPKRGIEVGFSGYVRPGPLEVPTEILGGRCYQPHAKSS
jgi:hypothetical protein